MPEARADARREPPPVAVACFALSVLGAAPACGIVLDLDFEGYSAAAQRTCNCGPLEECGPGDFCVAKMVSVQGGYSIDATEVTRSQYEAWLATSPAVASQVSVCSANATFQPMCEWPPATKANHPVVCVDWCDAYAYCAAVNKRLCGAIGGGALAWDGGAYMNPTMSQWFNACSSAGANGYPYGSTYDKNACNGEDRDATGCKSSYSTCAGECACSTVDVGSLPGCASSVPGFNGVFDLSGNVHEWEDCCEQMAGENDNCRVRGASFSDGNADLLRCGNAQNYGMNSRRGHGYNLGFRCCSI